MQPKRNAFPLNYKTTSFCLATGLFMCWSRAQEYVDGKSRGEIKVKVKSRAESSCIHFQLAAQSPVLLSSPAGLVPVLLLYCVHVQVDEAACRPRLRRALRKSRQLWLTSKG